MPSRRNAIHLVGLALALFLIVGPACDSRAQSTWQKMKLRFLEQACKGGDQNSCRQLAQLKQKLSQQGQAPQDQQQPQQEPQRQQPGPGRRQSADREQDGSGAVKPPAGTKVEETTLAPLAQGAKFFVSPHGVHVATFENSGSRAVIYYDGVPGPKFDDILGGSSNLPGEIQLVFSPDGKRYAYCGRLGDEMVVMVDGKEFLRSSESHLGRFDGNSCQLGFTSNSQHVYISIDVATSQARGGSFTRFIFDGKAAPASASGLRGSGDLATIRNVSFSPDGNHYAVIVTDPADESKWGLVIDGKIAPYRGGAMQWSADSRHLYTTIEHPGATGYMEAMLDGKPFMRADHLALHIAPAGAMVVAVVDGASRTPTPVQFLVVDGKKVPGTEIVHLRGGQIDQVTISADGKHYAARFTTSQGPQYVVVDGKRGQEYQKIDHLVFTSDSSKLTYTAFSNGKPYAIIGDQESETCLAEQSGPVIDTRGALMIAPVGGRAGTICGATGGAVTVYYMDGKTLPVPDRAQSAHDLRFSPDGQHYAFEAWFQGGARRLVIDGVLQMNTNLGTPSMPRFHYVFSPDSQHIAADSSPPTDTGQLASGLFLDGKYIPVVANTGMRRLEFTADSKHIVWGQTVPGRNGLRIFVDGKAVAEADMAMATSSREAWWDMAPDGSLLILAQDNQNLKRITITPSPETSLAALGGGGAALAKRNQ